MEVEKNETDFQFKTVWNRNELHFELALALNDKNRWNDA